MKIILFNGPPRSGKDTAATICVNMLGARAYPYRFAGPLKDATHAFFGMGGILMEHFDAVKDVKSKLFFGMSPREAYIWLSEEVAKPKFGKDFFARVAANHLRSIRNATVVISDCGFQVEADTLIEVFGEDNVHLVHILRDGTSFTGDSRSYINHKSERSYVLNNNSDLTDFKDSVEKLIAEIFNGTE